MKSLLPTINDLMSTGEQVLNGSWVEENQELVRVNATAASSSHVDRRLSRSVISGFKLPTGVPN